jgi:hypothetical protein
MSVHEEAAAFLAGLLKQRRADRVVITRHPAPKYLVGFKSSGAAVWAHDVRLARKFDQGSTELGEAVGALRGLEDGHFSTEKTLLPHRSAQLILCSP